MTSTFDWILRYVNNNELLEGEIKKTSPFTIAPRRIKYLRINLSKEVKDSYTKNDKILLQEIEDNTKK